MARLSIIWRTLTITKNPLAGFLLKRSRTRKAIAFRNGCIYRVTWPQFRYIRDNCELFSKYTLTQIEEDLFKLETEYCSIICNAQLLPLICELMQEYTITQNKPDLYCLKNGKVELVGSSDMLVCMQELRSGEYKCDCQGKVILDVGGFEGESAAYFWQKGAKKSSYTNLWTSTSSTSNET